VKELEERGIGRPSTYASIINTIQDREYVVKHGGLARAVLSHRDRRGGLRSAGEELPLHLRSRNTRPSWKKSWTTSKKARRSGPTC
jgi:hypothetical protein